MAANDPNSSFLTSMLAVGATALGPLVGRLKRIVSVPGSAIVTSNRAFCGPSYRYKTRSSRWDLFVLAVVSLGDQEFGTLVAVAAPASYRCRHRSEQRWTVREIN